MNEPTQQHLICTADELRRQIVTHGDWPKLAKLVARAIDTVASLERLVVRQREQIAQLKSELDARRRVA